MVDPSPAAKKVAEDAKPVDAPESGNGTPVV